MDADVDHRVPDRHRAADPGTGPRLRHPDATGRGHGPRRHRPGRLRTGRPGRRPATPARHAGVRRPGPRRRHRRPKKVPGARPKGRRARWLLTAVGRVRLTRQYVVTPAAGQFPADAVPGVAGYVTRAAERMAVLAGARDSFARAAVALRELSGWDLDDEAIRRLTHAAAARATATRADCRDATRFATAAGAAEVQVDAGKVNTDTG